MNTNARTLDEYIISWNVEEPLIGLNYVIEYQRDGGREPMYECTLCDFTEYLHVFVLHLGGFKHRMNYMTKEYPDMMKWDRTKLKEEELSNIVKERAAIIEKLEGRRCIQVVRGQDPPNILRVVRRVQLPSNSWQQEWERNPSRMEQELIEGIRNQRELSMRKEMMLSTPRDHGQYEADFRTSDKFDWRRDDKDFYGENVATDRFTDNRMQYRENTSSGYTDLHRDNKEEYVEPALNYNQYSNQRVDERRGLYGDLKQESLKYADWSKIYQQESGNDFRASDRYSSTRKDEHPQYLEDGRGTDYRRDDRKYEDEYIAREQIRKPDYWMEQKDDFSQPPNFSDVGDIDLKRKKLYDYLQNFKIRTEDDASFVLKVTNTFKAALISYYQRKETDPSSRATLDQRTTRSIGTPDGYSRYNPDVSASAVRDSESYRGVYDWKQDTLATNMRQSNDSSLYLSSATPYRNSALHSSLSRGYSPDYKSNTQDINWGRNADNTYYGR
ncbi:uncharacterized protein LOC132395630 isoform X1 [Hypanus sabinus]|uniref:uncharacterized protein LOC132395630 isoform X1 n=3 Tax=Hypanus sabinus TaxID=79690 RepID=UPI0028C37B04|nr:uncharacterized protein LOC132395630 isoform X1 [Hypanus sabinus]